MRTEDGYIIQQCLDGNSVMLCINELVVAQRDVDALPRIELVDRHAVQTVPLALEDHSVDIANRRHQLV